MQQNSYYSITEGVSLVILRPVLYNESCVQVRESHDFPNRIAQSMNYNIIEF